MRSSAFEHLQVAHGQHYAKILWFCPLATHLAVYLILVSQIKLDRDSINYHVVLLNIDIWNRVKTIDQISLRNYSCFSKSIVLATYL